MKTFKQIFAVFFFISGLSTSAQSSESIANDPTTNCVIRYYYYPNLEAYYDKQKDIYWYTEKGTWITAKEIPSGYRGYSTFNKVNFPITDYDDDNPIQFIAQHKKKYPYIMNSRQLAHISDGL